MLKLPIIIFIFIVLTAVMISYDFQQVSAQVSNSTTTNSTSVPSRVITLGDNTAGGIAYDPIRNTMYMTNIDPTGCTLHVGCVPPVGRPSYVTVINTTTNNVIRNIPVGLDPFGIAYDPIYHTMYVANSGSNTVSIINTTT